MTDSYETMKAQKDAIDEALSESQNAHDLQKAQS